jgi:hypothetical protein
LVVWEEVYPLRSALRRHLLQVVEVGVARHLVAAAGDIDHHQRVEVHRLRHDAVDLLDLVLLEAVVEDTDEDDLEAGVGVDLEATRRAQEYVFGEFKISLDLNLLIFCHLCLESSTSR